MVGSDRVSGDGRRQGGTASVTLHGRSSHKVVDVVGEVGDESGKAVDLLVLGNDRVCIHAGVRAAATSGQSGDLVEVSAGIDNVQLLADGGRVTSVESECVGNSGEVGLELDGGTVSVAAGPSSLGERKTVGVES